MRFARSLICLSCIWFVFGIGAAAQTPDPLAVQPHDRLIGPIDDSSPVALTGLVHPVVRAAASSAAVPATLPMQQMVLLLDSDAAQQAALDQLVEAQHDPKSPLYHHFLSPQEFGAHFGVSQNDLNKITAWLTSHGFTIDLVPEGRRSIIFSGT